MNKTLKEIKYELTTTLGRTSYLLITFGLPLLGLLVISILIGFPCAYKESKRLGL